MSVHYVPDSQPPIDAAALAAIRPGMPLAALRQAYGAAWREPAPHKGGKVDIAENSHGVMVRLDRNGVVGEVSYGWQFPTDTPVLGLRMELPIERAPEAMPTLEIGAPLQFMDHIRLGTARLADDLMLDIEFHTGSVHGIRLRNPDAVYAPEGPPPYPPATAPVGAPFEDPNFKLVVLSILLDAKVLDLGTPQQLAAHVLGHEIDLDRHWDRVPEMRAYLDRYVLTPELLAQVESLEFDGGNTVYRFAEHHWGSPWDGFDTTDFAGIELLPNVTRFDVISMVEMVDLRCLVPLRKLRHVKVDTDFRHLEALLDLPALRTCSLMGDAAYADVSSPGHETRRVMEDLKARGVKVWVHWMSHSGPGRPPAFE